MTEVIDYPFGDGQKGCPHCMGRGVVPAPPKPGRIIVGGRTVPCSCVLARDILRNVERGWRGLSLAAPIPDSPLTDQLENNLWITATQKTIREHLRHVAVRQGTKWGFNVVSDADLMDAWLSRIEDADVIDGDVHQMRQSVSSKYGMLVDLIEPPELLIVITGVKAARNSAMPEVMLETLNHRGHLNKPTWVVDAPNERMAENHISYSNAVGAVLHRWSHINLDSKEVLVPVNRMPTPQQNRMPVPQQQMRVPARPAPAPIPVPKGGVGMVEVPEEDEDSPPVGDNWLADELAKMDNGSGKKKPWGNKKR